MILLWDVICLAHLVRMEISGSTIKRTLTFENLLALVHL